MSLWDRILDLLSYLHTQKLTDTELDKRELQKLARDYAGLEKKRSLFFPDDQSFALRFSKANKTSFPGTVLALSKIEKYDNIPIVVCAVRPDDISAYLINSTFVIKVSHSSHALTVDNVRGSINGSDILTDFDGLANEPENFKKLFAKHQSVGWESNLERIVTNTTAIEGTGVCFNPTEVKRKKILAAPRLATSVISTDEYVAVEDELRRRLAEKEKSILKVAESENVNLRGNRIEKVITGDKSSQDLGDLVREVAGVDLHIDIKTKLAGRSSNPKAYNLDKMLELLSNGDLLGFFFVRIDRASGHISSKLLTIFDERILGATRIQHHWAGRNSRGVAQLSGDFATLIDESYQEHIDVGEATDFLSRLLDDSE